MANRIAWTILWHSPNTAQPTKASKPAFHSCCTYPSAGSISITSTSAADKPFISTAKHHDIPLGKPFHHSACYKQRWLHQIHARRVC